ncbi:MAG: rhomboid family intramembrane serine protease [Candidatus Aenigmatarchaeota archaeon]
MFERWSIRLALFCVFVFIAQVSFEPFTEAFVLVSSNVLFAPWTLITSIFLHGSLEHILYNMFALVLFGTVLESIIGHKRFLVLFFVGGFFASIGAAIFYNASLGASGAIFAILGALTMLRPKMVVWVAGIPMPMFVAAFVWALIDLVGMFAPGQTANAAHLFGLAFGLAYGYTLMKRYGEQPRQKSSGPLSKAELDSWERRWMLQL